MGEIKSTMDLVMERTRHLSMSEEERAQHKKEDFRKRLQGLLQRYEDGSLSVDAVQQRFASLQGELGQSDRRPLIEAVLRRMEPDRDNRHWLELLKTMEPSVCGPLEETLTEHRRRRAERLKAGRQRMRERLARDFGIEGSAVVPNPRRDPECRESLSALGRDTQSRIEAVFEKLP
ncbi:MAG: hypothetical protein LJE65_17600 [Desulfobacteraceae bacterium]|nr:hypothetical protein [Desulfobacteraceae bacterium]